MKTILRHVDFLQLLKIKFIRMKPFEVKKLVINALNVDANPAEASRILEGEGVSYDFGNGFSDKIIDKIFSMGYSVKSKVEFVKSLDFAFYRVAFTGVAAIVIMLISIFLMEGTISFNSFLGISDNYDESIVCLLTGN